MIVMVNNNPQLDPEVSESDRAPNAHLLTLTSMSYWKRILRFLGRTSMGALLLITTIVESLRGVYLRCGEVVKDVIERG